MPDWALGGHLAMSLSVLMSAERKRFRLGYLADAVFPHLKHRGLPQLIPPLRMAWLQLHLMAVHVQSMAGDALTLAIN